jgi:hypothetical protein
MVDCGSSGMTAAEKKKAAEREAEWQAERDLDTLIDAEKIKKDPKRMDGVMKRKKALMAALKDAGEK